MRIAILCGCLEEGKDGVGDYARILTGELIRLGHQSTIVALHDRLISQSVTIDATIGTAPILRLPACIPWLERISAAQAYLKEFAPEWISLQFVPYGYNDKGIDLMLGRNLCTIINERKLHIMFHELWIGAYSGASLKDRLIGIVQRHSIVQMARQLAPRVVTTSNAPYCGLLDGRGIPAARLPLFGNIPLNGQVNGGWLNEQMRAAELTSGNQDRSAYWLFAFFGTLHPIWPPEPLFSYMAKAAEKAGKKAVIVGIGRLGPGAELWQRLIGDYGHAFQFVHFGEQPVDRISELLHEADFAIATSPWELVEKSGTVASMIEHGLPVIVNRDDVRFGGTNQSDLQSNLLIKMDAALPNKLSYLRKAVPKPMLPGVAAAMLNYLQAADN